MPTGSELLDLARRHIGEEYQNVRVPKNNANWRGPWDCAEFMSWLVFQCAGFLYGCLDNSAGPDVPMLIPAPGAMTPRSWEDEFLISEPRRS